MLQQQITRERALGMVSNLIGIDLKGPEDIMEKIRELTPKSRKSN